MGNIVKTAKCRFCGQMTQIEADEELTAAQAEEQATMTCNCTDAVEYQKEKQRKEKAMQNLPSDTQETGQKVHQIRLAKSYFDDVANGIKTFELRKNDRGYKKGDILEMMEFADGKNTGCTMLEYS